jgi:hypothetical protein
MPRSGSRFPYSSLSMGTKQLLCTFGTELTERCNRLEHCKNLRSPLQHGRLRSRDHPPYSRESAVYR